MNIRIISVVGFIVLFSMKAFPQSDDFKLHNYLNSVKNSAIMSAPLATRYNLKYEGTYYLETENYSIGKVCYNGIVYDSILLNLNAYEDCLQTKLNVLEHPVILDTKLVEYFYLDQRYFIHIGPDNDYLLSSGYYEVLYSQGDTLLRKNVKDFKGYIEQRRDVVVNIFSDNISYYLIKGGKSHSIKNRRDILNLYSERKREINREMRLNGVFFGRDAELFLVTVLNYLNNEGN